MKRRQVIKNIALASSGVFLLPACKLTDPLPTYTNLPLDADQLALMDWLTDAILPKGELPISTPEPTTHFVLTMINDCFNPEGIQKYLTGLRIFNQYLQDEYPSPYQNLNAEQHILLFAKIEKSDLLPESMHYFLNTTKGLTVQHFASSEYFLKNYLDFEFIPGRYSGCVNV